MAINRSNDIATSVNTETPVEKSFINSDILHIREPHGHDSTVYTTDTNGTAVNISMRSAMLSDKICLQFGMYEKLKRKMKEREREIKATSAITCLGQKSNPNDINIKSQC